MQSLLTVCALVVFNQSGVDYGFEFVQMDVLDDTLALPVLVQNLVLTAKLGEWLHVDSFLRRHAYCFVIILIWFTPYNLL